MQFIERIKDIVNVAAGSAVNTTYTEYVFVGDLTEISTQVNWTAGSGGGAIVVKCYGTNMPFTDASSCAGAGSDDFVDIGTTILGGASLTADALVFNKTIKGLSWLKYTVAITDKDDSTAYRVRVRGIGC